jgi:hypothetical protein
MNFLQGENKMLKYNLGERVYYFENEKIRSGIIIARRLGDRVKNFFTYAGDPQNDRIDPIICVEYIVHDKNENNHQFGESRLFKNEAELINSLYE